jgi:hypothetical protein
MRRNENRRGVLRSLVRRLGAVIAECNEAQRRLTILRTAPDRFMADPDRVPDTYAEFMYRTSGLLAHEPPARARIKRHRPVR